MYDKLCGYAANCSPACHNLSRGPPYLKMIDTIVSRRPSSNCHTHFSFEDIHRYQGLFGLATASPGVQGSILTSAILDLKDDFKPRNQDRLEISALDIYPFIYQTSMTKWSTL
jgi:hypothetical protein